MKLTTPALTLICLLAIISGCAGTAPPYQATNENIQALSRANSKKIGSSEFGYGPKGQRLNQLSIRGGSYDSPIENSWAAYLREALKTELQAAGRWDTTSDIKVSSTILENELDGSSMSTGTAHISARFIVEKSGTKIYDRVVTADHSWESSFMGAVAIPAARQNYIATMSMLLGKLFSDKDFLLATS